MNVTPVSMMNVLPHFTGQSWDSWRQVLARITPDVREFWATVGRGSGKSSVIGGPIACSFAAREYHRAPGENIFIGIFAPDRKQAQITFRYVRGNLHSVPELAALIVNETATSIELATGVIVEVVTASTAAPRGRAYALAVIEESSMLPCDDSANPDVELLRAIRPALARVPGSLLCVVGSPYARRGIVYDAARKYRSTGGGPGVVYVQGSTEQFNPTFDAQAIATAFAEDPTGAAAEYGGEFRSDAESYVQREVIEAAVRNGPLELPRLPGVSYQAFVDPAGGGGPNADSFTAAVGHREGDRIIVDAVWERRPPFSPESAVKEIADNLRRYGIYQAQADRYAGQFPTEHFAKSHITIRAAEKPKSDLYVELLPMLNSGKVEIPDNPRLIAQLLNLERRTARGGRDTIDHPRGMHDDLANVIAGVCVMLAGKANQYVQVVRLAEFVPNVAPGALPPAWADADLPAEMQSDPAWRSYVRQFGATAALERWKAMRSGTYADASKATDQFSTRVAGAGGDQ